MQEYIKPLDDFKLFLQTLLQVIITDQGRVLYSLPVKHRGLGIPILSEISEIHYKDSNSISVPLASVIIMQGSQIRDSKIINEIKYSKTKESNVLLKEKIPSIRNLMLKQRKLSTMRVNLVHYPGLVPSHLSSIVLA